MNNKPTAELLQQYRADKRSSGLSEVKSDQGVVGDIVDATQQGAYEGVAGIAEFVGADGVRDWAKENSAEQTRTMSEAGRSAMQKQFFETDNGDDSTLYAGDAWTDPRAIAMQLGKVLGMNADIVASGGTVTAGRLAVTKVAKVARQKMLQKGATAEMADVAAKEATKTWLQKQTAKHGELAGNVFDYGVAGHAVSSGLQAIDIRDEVNEQDFDQLAQLPEYKQLVLGIKQANPHAPADEVLAEARKQLGEQAAAAIKTNPTLLTANMLVGGLGTTALMQILRGVMPKGAGVATELLVEGTQGTMEQVAMNQEARDYVDPTREQFDGALVAGLNEAVMGGAMGATAAGARYGWDKTKAALDARQQKSLPELDTELPPLPADDGDLDLTPEMENYLAENDPQKLYADRAGKVRKYAPDFVDRVTELVTQEPHKAMAAAATMDNYLASYDYGERAEARLSEYLNQDINAAGNGEVTLENRAPTTPEQDKEDYQQLYAVAAKQHPDFAQKMQRYVDAQPNNVGLAADVLARYIAEPDFRPLAQARVDEHLTELGYTKRNTNVIQQEQQAPADVAAPQAKPAAAAPAERTELSWAKTFAADYLAENGELPADDMLVDTFDLSPDELAQVVAPYREKSRAPAAAEELALQVDDAAQQAATSVHNDLPEPTPAQIEAGNYKKGKVNLHGLNISVENPRGSMRKGIDPDGNAWQVELKDSYGYIRGTEGADGEHVDVFIGEYPDSDKVFVVDQVNADGSFDEHKVILGATDLDNAVETYSRNYEPGWTVGPVTEMSVAEFKTWLKDGSAKKPAKAQVERPAAAPENSATDKLKLNIAKELQLVKGGTITLDEDMGYASAGTYEIDHIDNQNKGDVFVKSDNGSTAIRLRDLWARYKDNPGALKVTLPKAKGTEAPAVNGVTGKAVFEARAAATDEQINALSVDELRAALLLIGDNKFKGLDNVAKGVVRHVQKNHGVPAPEMREVLIKHRDYWVERARSFAEADAKEAETMQRRYGHMSLAELETEAQRLSNKAGGARRSGEISDGRRSSVKATSNEAARSFAEEEMRLQRYIAERKTDEASQPVAGSQQESRDALLAKAKEQGFDVENIWHRGSLFDSAEMRFSGSDHFVGAGVYLTNDRNEAEDYASKQITRNMDLGANAELKAQREGISYTEAKAQLLSGQPTVSEFVVKTKNVLAIGNNGVTLNDKLVDIQSRDVVRALSNVGVKGEALVLLQRQWRRVEENDQKLLVNLIGKDEPIGMAYVELLRRNNALPVLREIALDLNADAILMKDGTAPTRQSRKGAEHLVIINPMALMNVSKVNFDDAPGSEPQIKISEISPRQTEATATAPALVVEDYSEKSIVVRGDTKPYKEQLNALKGVFNPRLKDGAGWVFSKKREAEVRAEIDKINQLSNTVVLQQEGSDDVRDTAGSVAADGRATTDKNALGGEAGTDERAGAGQRSAIGAEASAEAGDRSARGAAVPGARADDARGASAEPVRAGSEQRSADRAAAEPTGKTDAMGYADDAGAQADNGASRSTGKQTDPGSADTALNTPLPNATAPEHVVVGVDDRELADIVAEFNAAMESSLNGDNGISNVFKHPDKKDIVRLADKVKVYQKDHGWMSLAQAKKQVKQWKAAAKAQYDNPATRGANSEKIVLSLFDKSGQWSQPWEDAGYQVYRFDIQNDTEVGDVNNFSTDFFYEWFDSFEGQQVYAILAACPCTDFAVSGARHFAAKDEDGRTIASVKLVHQTLRTIEYFKPAVWALENPVGRIEKLGGLPNWRLSFDPNHLGDPYTKKTLIWGRFNGDLPIAPVFPAEGSKMHSQYGGSSQKTKDARSVTPEGFAYAFFVANNAADHPALEITGIFDRLDADLIKEALRVGVTPAEIKYAVEDYYYMDLDDDAANAAIRELIADANAIEAEAVPAAAAPVQEAAPAVSQQSKVKPAKAPVQVPAAMPLAAPVTAEQVQQRLVDYLLPQFAKDTADGKTDAYLAAKALIERPATKTNFNREQPEYGQRKIDIAGYRALTDALNNVDQDAVIAGLAEQVGEYRKEQALRVKLKSELDNKAKAQLKAESVKYVQGNAQNIRDSLPYLDDLQQDDVIKAENRLYVDDKKGMLLANGTGTGKTFSGGGVIKRALKRGAKRVLVVSPAGMTSDWQQGLKALQVKAEPLTDTKDAGSDNVVALTSYENFYQNKAILDQHWDLLVYDESHKLMGNMQGDTTEALNVHRMLSRYSDYSAKVRAQSLLSDEAEAIRAKIDALIEKEAKRSGKDPAEVARTFDTSGHWAPYNKKVDALAKKYESWQADAQTKTLFLSASPFATHKALFYMDGYVFDSKEGASDSKGYNVGSPQDQFLVKHLGYRMRYNRPNKPEAGVDVGLLERELADMLVESGGMSIRRLDVEKDYSREFVKLNSKLGDALQLGFDVLNQKRFSHLQAALREKLKGGKDHELLEALRVKESVERIKQHIALGRKVVVFHERQEISITHPFRFAENSDEAYMAQLAVFKREYPNLYDLPLTGLKSVPQQLEQAFGRNALALFSGKLSKKAREAELNDFKDDAGSRKILVIQKQAGKEGISPHDVTGKFPRVLMIMSTPVSPTDLIQMEGRVFRRGLASNAVIELPIIGTKFEQHRYRGVVSERTGTAENLAMGGQARDLRNVLRESYLDPRQSAPDEKQGTGGKTADALDGEIDNFTRAKTYYWKRAKKTSKTKSAEGADYFATPEPMGLAMVSMADIQPGDKVLEPSAGHGAIARFFPETSSNVAIELSDQLTGELGMVVDGRVIEGSFHDHHIVNKYHSVVMNPPFGHGGSDAIKFIEKGFNHLYNGGRMVAIIPRGKMDERFDTWLSEQREAHLVATIELPGITFSRAGTGVITRVVIVDKDKRGSSDYARNIDLSRVDDINELFERFNEISVRARPDVTIPAADVGMYQQTKKQDGRDVLELSQTSGKPGIDKNVLKKLADRYNGEVSKDSWGDTSYTFDTQKDVNRFLEAMQDKIDAARAGVDLDAPALSMAPENAEKGSLDLGVVNAVIDRVVPKEQRGAVHVKRTLFDLPVEVLSGMAQEHDIYAPDYKVRGVYHDGNIYVIHDQNPTEIVLEDTLLHEMMHGHIRTVGTPAEVEQMLEDLFVKMGGYDGIAKLTYAAKFPAKLYAEQHRNKSPAFLRMMMVDELLAHAAGVQARNGKTDSVVNAILAFFGKVRDWLRKNGLTKLGKLIDVTPGNYNMADLLHEIRQIKHEANKNIKAKADATAKTNTANEADNDIRFSQANVSSGAPRARGVPVADIEAMVAKFMKGLKGASGIKVKVLRTQAEAQLEWQKSLDGKVVKGAYFDKLKTVYIIAGNAESLDGARRTLAHEVLAHGGLKSVIGPVMYQQFLDRINKTRGKKEFARYWDMILKDYAEFDADTQAEELFARFVEEQPIAKGVALWWQAFKKWLNGVLAAVGIVPAKDEDMAAMDAMLDSIVQNFRKGRALRRPIGVSVAYDQQPDSAAGIETNIRFSLASRGAQAVQDSITALQQTRLDGLANILKPSKIWQAIKLKWPDLRPAMLATLPRNYLADIAGALLPSLNAYNKQVAAMEAERNRLLSQTHDTADAWRKLVSEDKKASEQLADLMHEATMVGVDPSNDEYVPNITKQVADVLMRRARAFIKSRNGEAWAVSRGMNRLERIKEALEKEPSQREAYELLRKAYLALPATHQAMFKQVRDDYKEMSQRRREALEDRIRDLIQDKRVSAAQIAMMQEEFELADIAGVYFPLQRFGKYRAVAKDAQTGETLAFSMFETNAEMQAWLQEQAVEGVITDGGYMLDYSRVLDGVGSGFMKDLLKQMAPIFSRNDKLQDEVYQLFLQHSPELSMRKHMIHRKGVKGFDADALRAYAHNMFHGAYQVAKTKHTHHMQSHLMSMADEARGVADANDKVRATQVVNEMQKRNDWILNPQGSELAAKMTGFGFFWYLGTSPAAALVNITQTPMIGLPVLGSRYGYKQAGKALLDASKAFIKGRGHVDKALSGRELEAFKAFEESGVIDKTQAHDVTGIADGGVAYSPRYHKVMKVAGFMFHHAERFNREVTAMAAYRLAFERVSKELAGKPAKLVEQLAHAKAIEAGMELVKLSHFDYANSNRARVIQSDAARVLLLFRQHSINMTYRLLRDFQQSFWGSAEEKAQARKQLAGILGIGLLFSGAAGLPLYSVVAGIFNTLGGDEDEPFNFDIAVREALTDAIGETAASLVMNGTAGTLTGADLTGRIGMNNLWFREPDVTLEGEAVVQYYAEQALGPMFGIATGWGRAAYLANQGDTARAWEAAVPKFARDWFKSVRFAQDGVQSRRGDAIIDELSPWQIALQANGFTPLELSEQYRENSFVKGTERQLLERRKLLMNRYALGKRLFDAGLVDETLDAIDKFNQANPGVKITAADRIKSLKQRHRISDSAVNGVVVSKKLAYLQEQN